jgi:hypothetical protein
MSSKSAVMTGGVRAAMAISKVMRDTTTGWAFPGKKYLMLFHSWNSPHSSATKEFSFAHCVRRMTVRRMKPLRAARGNQENGNTHSFSALSCAGFFKFASSQSGQNFQSNFRVALFRCQSDHGTPMAGRDASRLPTAHGRVPLSERFCDRAGPTEPYNYRFPIIHAGQHSSHAAN